MSTRTCALIAVLVLPSGIASAADTSRYPRENAAFAGTFLGSYHGKHEDLLIMSLQIRTDPTYSAAQRTLIDRSMGILLDRALKEHVIDCAYAHSSKDLPSSRQDFEIQLYGALSHTYIAGNHVPSFGFIARYRDDPGSVGMAYVNLYYDHDNALPGYDHRHYLHIALNSDHMGPTSSYIYADDAEYWAGVIGHEFLHNLGYVHPTGYAGSFIKEYGKCVTGNGQSYEEAEDAVEDDVVYKGD